MVGGGRFIERDAGELLRSRCGGEFGYLERALASWTV
jgi:hypothetical protein